MGDLVELFEKIVSLNGIARVIPLLVDKSVNIDGQDDDLAGSDDNSSDDSYTDEIMIMISQGTVAFEVEMKKVTTS